VTHSDDFPEAFERALKSSTGAVIELMTSVEAISPTKTLEKIRAESSKH